MRLPGTIVATAVPDVTKLGCGLYPGRKSSEREQRLLPSGTAGATSMPTGSLAIVATAVPDVTKLGGRLYPDRISKKREQPLHPSGTAGATMVSNRSMAMGN